MKVSPTLLETLRDAQRFGFFGSRPMEDAVDHSAAFVDAVRADADSPTERIVDIGSGGGLPGLVLAEAFPDSHVLLIDRRQKRTDFLERAIARLKFDHVTVRHGEVEDLVHDVAEARVPPFDVVTARGFGPPDLTLRVSRALIGPTGRIVISEPPSGDRWNTDLLVELGLRHARRGAVRVFRFT